MVSLLTFTNPYSAATWLGKQIGGEIKENTDNFQKKAENPIMNNYKANLDLPTYNSRYPYFDEEDYKKLEQGAISRGLTGDKKTQFMDEAYQYYYPQVLNRHGLNARAEQINKTAAENGTEVLNGNKNVEWNLKLIDLAQTAKRVKGLAYDYPDEKVLDAMKTRIPDGEQLLLNYLNNGDDTLLYKAGLKKTDDQVRVEEYNKKKNNINKALQENWKELSDDGLKYLRDYNVMFQTVDEARLQGMGQGMTDNELLLNLIYLSPELQQLQKEIDSLNLDGEDLAILGEARTDLAEDWNKTKNNFRDWIGLNAQDPATLDDLAEEIYVRENMDGQTWKNMQANFRNWGDDVAKFTYRAPKDARNRAMDTDLSRFGAKLFGGWTDEEYDQRVQDIKTENINKVKWFNEQTEKEKEAYKKKIGLDPIIENYYNKQGVLESLFNDNPGGAWYKTSGEMAGNVDSLIGIAGSIVNPGIGLTLMGTDTYARENQEAFENLINAQTSQGISYEDAYETASEGATYVGLINTAIELGLEKFLGGLETTTANNIKQMVSKDLNKEVSEMLAKRGIMDMITRGLGNQARASLEEGMEEVFQQMVQNIAASSLDPNQEISEGLWEAFESGALNPMNLLAGISGTADTISNMDKDTFLQWVNSLDIGKEKIPGSYSPKSIIDNVKNGGKNNINQDNTEDVKKPFLTRTMPEGMVANELGLSAKQIQDIKDKGVNPAELLLSKNMAKYNDTGRATALEQLIINNYNKITELAKSIGNDKRFESEDVHAALGLMIERIENSDVLSKSPRYKPLLEKFKQLNAQKDFSYAELLAIRRDFDVLEGYEIYGKDGKIRNGEEKKELGNVRNTMVEALNKMGEENGVDVKQLNKEISAAVDIKNGILKKMSQDEKNNYFSLSDLGWGAVLTSGNPIKAATVMGIKKFAESKSGKLAQYLYNLNNTPVAQPAKRGTGLSNNNNNAGNRFSTLNLGDSVSDTRSQQTEIDVSNLDVGANPMDTINDKNVGVNPMDVVETTDTSKSATKPVSTRDEYSIREELKEEKKPKKTTKKGKKGAVKQYADNTYRPSITMNVDDYINEKTNESLTDDNFTEKYEYQKLKDDLKNAEDTFYEIMKEYGKTKDQKLLEVANKQSKKIEKINGDIDRLINGEEGGKKGKVKQYADNVSRPSITMKVDDYEGGGNITKKIDNMKNRDEIKVGKYEIKKLSDKTFMVSLKNDPWSTEFLDREKLNSLVLPAKEKNAIKKSRIDTVNNIIQQVWHDIGDEGDWDWYKKMKKKDVLAYVKDQVSDDMRQYKKNGADFGLEWSEIEKLIKKYVDSKMK